MSQGEKKITKINKEATNIIHKNLIALAWGLFLAILFYGYKRSEGGIYEE